MRYRLYLLAAMLLPVLMSQACQAIAEADAAEAETTAVSTPSAPPEVGLATATTSLEAEVLLLESEIATLGPGQRVRARPSYHAAGSIRARASMSRWSAPRPRRC